MDARQVAAIAAVVLGLAGSARGQQPADGVGQAPTAEELKAIAGSRAILVIELAEREEKHFSGMHGSTFFFRVREVLRFEAEPGTARDARWRHVFDVLSARARTLARTHMLEWDWLWSDGDDEDAAADAATVKALPKGRTFVLAAPTTAWFSDTGVVRDDAWGKLLAHGPVLIRALDAEALAALRGRLADAYRVPSPPSPSPAAGPGVPGPAPAAPSPPGGAGDARR